MPTLRWTSTVLTTIGCQKPSSWTSSTKILLYKVYGILVLFLMQTVTLTTILDIVFNVKTQNDFGNNLYLTVPMVIACCKLCSFLANRDSILILMHAMQKKPYLPVDDDELRIETRYDTINERITSLYTISVELCVMMVWVTSLMRDPKNRTLAFRAWHPYNYSSPILYAATYAHQAVSVTIASLVNAAYDSLFSGLLFSIYSQLEILGHRLQQVKSGSESARECVRQHNFIYQFATKVNEDFQVVVFVQFMASMTIICFTLYRITQTDLGSRLAETVVYALCMLVQIFFYCWYGNEVKLKSREIQDLIFASNWPNLDENTRRMLLMIMLRSASPIEFLSVHIVSVNLESFMAVLKTSYSAYSVLQ
ncbi:odorant receptor Or1-like [Augochlora pura]